MRSKVKKKMTLRTGRKATFKRYKPKRRRF